MVGKKIGQFLFKFCTILFLGQKYSHETAAPKKPKVDGDVYEKIVEKMELEIKFYNLVKTRFYKLKSELLLNNRLPDHLLSTSKIVTKLNEIK